MKITGLHIYGFGKLENVVMENLSPNIQVIYGENEAGKSTVMAFIQAILFGFPAKNQQDLRYVPKKGFKYGGKLVIETNDKRKITIERVAGRSSGDVTVQDEQGNPCNLNDVLGDLDKTMYKGIFSFNIMDIQNLQLIDSEQLGGYLFSSGLMGSEQLHKLSRELAKDQEERFKPNGRKPVINQLLTSLKEEEGIVHQWKEKMGQYDRLQKDMNQYDIALKESHINKADIEQKIKETEAMLTIQPLVNRMEILELQLAEVGNVESFPRDGLARLEKWQTEVVFYQSKLEKMKKELEEKEREIEQIWVNEEVLEKEETVKSLVTLVPTYQQAKDQLSLLETEIAQLEKRVEGWKQDLEWTEKTDYELEAIPTSLASKGSLRELLKTHHEIHIQKQRLDEQFQLAKEELEAQEERVKDLEQEQLPNHEVLKMKEMVELEDKDTLHKEIHLTEQLLNQLKKQLDVQKRNDYNEDRKGKQIAFVSIILGIVGAIYFFMQDQLIPSLFCLVLFSLLSITLRSNTKNKANQNELIREKDELHNKLDLLRGKLLSNDTQGKLEVYQKALAKNEQVMQLLQKERLLLSQCERTYNRIIHQFEEWEGKNYSLQEQWHKWTSSLSLVQISPTFMEEAYDKVVQLKGAISDKKELVEKQRHYQLVVDKFQKELNTLLDENNETNSRLTTEEVFTQLRVNLEENVEKQKTKQQIQEQIDVLTEEIEGLSQHIYEASKQIQHLYEQAKVKDEEAFRHKNQQNVEKIELEKELALLKSQLVQMENSFQLRLTDSKPMDIWKAEKAELEETLKTIKEKQSQLVENRTATKETIRLLEESGTYSEAVQQFELSKSKLQEHARKWAIHATASHLLGKTMDFYRTVKLPKVLQYASDNFRFLTKGNYLSILDAQNERTLKVQHADGTKFEPKELSQATVEQLYISLRVAVAQVWSEEQKLPFLMDDSFVNFDEQRTNLAIKLINRLALQGYQFFFFTCHHHIKEKLADDQNNRIFTFDSMEVGEAILKR
ncbi:AAA family ATPase [Bacillus sp. RO1]|uniref:ATP-binding protein n=1 Tax=Bacillus sp. RO1 TaxID=2722703 RepID=UPI0014566BF3|nr:AAA family ATPase [Bacillus sp. RO1]NLP49962.1 AAA family ATPase [Bacillus sp. RO1]